MRRKQNLGRKHIERTRKRTPVRVFALSDSASLGTLRYGHMVFRAALGGRGVRTVKREGDGAAPLGSWPILWAYYRPDKVRHPKTGIPLHPIRQDAGWCDEPEDRNYNRPVGLPYKASAERLWRDDGLYDLVVVIDYNLRSRSKGRGSAIFMHAAHPAWDPTAGCIAISLGHLRQLLAALRPRTSVAVGKNLPQRPQRGRRGLR